MLDLVQSRSSDVTLTRTIADFTRYGRRAIGEGAPTTWSQSLWPGRPPLCPGAYGTGGMATLGDAGLVPAPWRGDYRRVARTKLEPFLVSRGKAPRFGTGACCGTSPALGGGSGNDPVMPDTLFSIGSMAKTMTAIKAATAVDDELITWDTPVVEVMPQFQLSDAAATGLSTLKKKCHWSCPCQRPELSQRCAGPVRGPWSKSCLSAQSPPPRPFSGPRELLLVHGL